MKKLMIAMAAVAMISAAQAEQSLMIINASAYEGYKIMIMSAHGKTSTAAWDADAKEAQVLEVFNTRFMNEETAWQSSGATSWSEHYSAFETYLSYEVSDGQAMGKNSMGKAIFLLLADGFTPGGEYVLTKAMTSDDGVFDFTTVPVLSSGKLMQDVPEPTSGLLMLLGMAGLALKRRKA